MARGKAGSSTVSNKRELRQFLRNGLASQHTFAILACLAVGVAVLIYQISRGASKPEIAQLRDGDQALAEKIFKSGDPWIVTCEAETAGASSPSLVFDSFEEMLSLGIMTAVANCDKFLLPSGKSITERFGINRKLQPTVFVVANGNKPRQLPMLYMRSKKQLVDEVKQIARKSYSSVSKQKDLEEKCLKRKSCLAILKGKKLTSSDQKVISGLMSKHRLTHFITLDSSTSQLSEEPPFISGEHRAMHFASSGAKSGPAATQVKVTSFDGPFTTSALSQFLQGAEEGKDPDTKIFSNPTINQRKRVVENNDRRSRDRAKSRGKTGSSSESSSSTGGFEDTPRYNYEADGTLDLPTEDEPEPEVLDLD